jgi:hypothetical protein
MPNRPGAHGTAEEGRARRENGGGVPAGRHQNRWEGMTADALGFDRAGPDQFVRALPVRANSNLCLLNSIFGSVPVEPDARKSSTAWMARRTPSALDGRIGRDRDLDLDAPM